MQITGEFTLNLAQLKEELTLDTVLDYLRSQIPLALSNVPVQPTIRIETFYEFFSITVTYWDTTINYFDPPEVGEGRYYIHKDGTKIEATVRSYT